jgi:putative redox protein
VHLAQGPSARGAQVNVVVLCHGFPVGSDSAARVGTNLASLADRLAAESEWRVLVGCLRGVGESDGDFSLDGWYADLQRLVDHGADLARGGGVWVIGFGTGGALGLCVAADDGRVRGAACLGSQATFADWANDVRGMVEYARRVGVIRDPGFPPDQRQWAAAFTALRPDEAAAKIAPRPLLLVHGADDEEVPVADGRILAEAAGPSAELRVLQGAGHRLRADPRAVALLAGWLERQGP